LNFTAGHNNNSAELLFSEIFRQQENRLYTLALRLTKSDEVAKDIIQEVFLKLWEHRSDLQSINCIEAWLYRITENKVIDFLRKVSADSKMRQQVWSQLQSNADDAQLHFEAREYNSIIQKAIEQLPPQRRLIYRMNRDEGMNYQQIADELQLSRHTVKNQLFTAVQSVRRFLSNVKLFSIFF
jgi:RNA polymerase sigma-70 factor (family 1)